MAADSEPLRILLVGAGRITASHVEAIDAHVDTLLVGVVDPDRTAAEAIAVPRTVWTTDSLDDAVRGADPDAAIIATPTTTHAELATQALRAGLHVMIEKPVAQTTDEVVDVVATAHRADRIATAAQVVRFLPTTSVVREMVRSAKIGDVEQIIQRRLEHRDAALRWWHDVDHFLLGHWGSHSIDLAIDLLDISVETVHCRVGARLSGFGGTDNVNLLASLEGGGRMSLNLSMTSRRAHHDLVIIGTRGTAEIVGYSEVFLDSERVYAQTEPEVLRAGFAAQLDDFVRAIRGDAPSASSAASTLACHDVLDAAQRSIESGTIEPVHHSEESIP